LKIRDTFYMTKDMCITRTYSVHSHCDTHPARTTAHEIIICKLIYIDIQRSFLIFRIRQQYYSSTRHLTWFVALVVVDYCSRLSFVREMTNVDDTKYFLFYTRNTYGKSCAS